MSQFSGVGLRYLYNRLVSSGVPGSPWEHSSSLGGVPITWCRGSPSRGATGRRLVTVENRSAPRNHCSVLGAGVTADTVTESRPTIRHLLLSIDSEYSVQRRPYILCEAKTSPFLFSTTLSSHRKIYHSTKAWWLIDPLLYSEVFWHWWFCDRKASGL